jgi:phospholipid/cholesterol/gamma-HCH transport system substrate-binding protein
LKFAKEIKVGLLIIVASALLYLGMNYLKGNNPFKQEIFYFVKYKKIEGLELSSPVTINGVKVGKVKQINFLENDIRNIIVKISLSNNYQIPDSSTARIYSLDLMGSKGIQIVLSDNEKFYNVGDTMLSSIEMNLSEQVSAQVAPLKKKTEELMGGIDSILVKIEYIFNKTNRANIDKSFEAIKRTFQNLERTSVTLDTLMTNEKHRLHNIFVNIESITSNFKDNNEKLSSIIQNFDNLSDSLSKAEIVSTINNANNALISVNTILQKIERGEGSMGMLINNDSLYNNLNNSAESLDKLLIDLRENPKRYLHYSVFDFGKTIVVDEEGYNKEKEKQKRKEEKKAKKNKKKDNSGNETSSNEVIYKIQIRSSKNKINKNSKEFKGIQNVEENNIENLYKYTVGSFHSMQEAVIKQRELRKNISDAFVVAYKGNEQISITEAKRILGK